MAEYQSDLSLAQVEAEILRAEDTLRLDLLRFGGDSSKQEGVEGDQEFRGDGGTRLTVRTSIKIVAAVETIQL